MSTIAPLYSGLPLIAKAAPADCADLARLIRHAFAAYRGVLVPESGAHGETAETLKGALEQGPAFLARMDGETAGCIFTQRKKDNLYLGRLAVLPPLRHRGIGSALLNAVEAEARSLGIPRLELGVRLVLVENIRLFQRAGFAIIRQERHPGFAVPTYHVMEKVLVR